jgi:hypothetical protein
MLYFIFIVFISSIYTWIFTGVSLMLSNIPRSNMPAALLGPLATLLNMLFLSHIVGKCLKAIPLGKYTRGIGIILVLLISIVLIYFVGIFEVSFIKGYLFK